MSQRGINLDSGAFQQLQIAREKLMRLACAGKPPDRQDILLSHLMGKGNDAMKTYFMHIIDGMLPDGKTPFKITRK